MPASDLEQRLRALRQQFLDGLPARAGELEAWLAGAPGERDPAVVVRIAHRLRGVAPSHGLTVLGSLAASIEDGCKTWDAEQIEQAARALQRALHESAPRHPRGEERDEKASDEVTAPSAPSSDPPKLLSGRRVVAIDDDPVMRRLLTLTLETVGGARAVVVGTAAELVAELERARADLVISDLMMPDESGPELLRRLRDRDLLQTARVVVLSAASEVEQRSQGALLDPRWIWFAKPFRPPQLVQALADLLDPTRDDRGR